MGGWGFDWSSLFEHIFWMACCVDAWWVFVVSPIKGSEWSAQVGVLFPIFLLVLPSFETWKAVKFVWRINSPALIVPTNMSRTESRKVVIDVKRGILRDTNLPFFFSSLQWKCIFLTNIIRISWVKMWCWLDRSYVPQPILTTLCGNGVT